MKSAKRVKKDDHSNKCMAEDRQRWKEKRLEMEK